MKALDGRDIIDDVIAIAHDAGERILEIYRDGFDVETKSDGTPLTDADRGSHELIAERLQQLTPDTPLVSEESVIADYEERRNWPRYWLIDPLDGTKEFVKRSGEFTVNIALMQRDRPMLGVVHTPDKGWTHWAVAGGGAWRQEPLQAPRRIQVREYRGGRATVVASRSHGQVRLKRFLGNLERAEGPYELANMGSALKICLVAEGTGDIYPRFGPTGEWDTAAADIVLSEAGGKLVNFDDRPLQYNKAELLNPFFLAVCAGDYDWTPLLAGIDAD